MAGAREIGDGNDDGDTPLTDALIDQFAGYYLVAVLAVRALEETRHRRRLAEGGQKAA